MRLLITGSAEHWAIENYYRNYLSACFPDCYFFDSADRLSRFLSGNYINKILFRTGLSSVLNRINAELLAQTAACRPDAVLIFKGIEILPQTLLELKRQGIKLFNYNPDHPFIRTFRSGGGKNIETCVPLYDVHFCYSKMLMEDINKRFGIDTDWLPFGFELDPLLFEKLQQEPEINRACFAGNPDNKRAAFLQELEKAGIPVDVYGHQWNKFLRSGTAIKIHDAVYADEFWKVLRRYRVQLNLFRPHNAGSHNMRSFEVPAAGGIMLAPDTLEHRYFFENGKEVFLYKNTEDCIVLLKDLLSAKNTETDIIRIAARKRSITEDYSYKRRAHDVYVKINSINK